MRVLILGSFSEKAPRHRIIADGLRLNGVTVEVRSLPLGASTVSRLRLVLKAVVAWRHFDVVIIPAFNQMIAPFVWLLTRLTRTPVLLDYMVGLGDVVADRANVSVRRAQFYRWVDRFNLRMYTSITDTEEHIRYFERMLGQTFSRLHVLPVGVQPEWLEAPPAFTGKPLTALFIGTFIPFQGVDIILEAAALLREDRNIGFELVGWGQGYKAAQAMVEQLKLDHVTLVNGFFPIAELTQRAERAAVILGVFGASDKTAYVIPHKVFDGMAMGRALITAESPAVEQYFTSGVHYLSVKPGSAEALAGALRYCAENPMQCAEMGRAAQARIREEFLPEQIGARLMEVLQSLVKSEQ